MCWSSRSTCHHAFLNSRGIVRACAELLAGLFTQTPDCSHLVLVPNKILFFSLSFSRDTRCSPPVSVLLLLPALCTARPVSHHCSRAKESKHFTPLTPATSSPLSHCLPPDPHFNGSLWEASIHYQSTTCRKNQQCSGSIRVRVRLMPTLDPILTDTHRTGLILALVLSQNSCVKAELLSRPPSAVYPPGFRHAVT